MTTSTRRRCIALLVAMTFASASLPALPAFAEPTASDLETARELYKEGRALRDKNDLKAALEKFKGAHALASTPVTGLELGRTHMLLTELVEAREAFLSVAKIPFADKESTNVTDARAEAAKLADELKPRIPSLKVIIKGPKTLDKVKVRIDEANIPIAALGSARKLNPGKHEVIGRLGAGEEKHATVELKEGQSQEITLELADAPVPDAMDGAAGGATAEGPTVPGNGGTPNGTGGAPKDAASSSGNGTVMWIGFGVAGAGVLVGGITGIVALSKASSVKDGCPEGKCGPALHDSLNTSRTMGTVSTLSFIVAGVGAGIGLYGLFSHEKSEPTHAAHVTPWIGLGSAGISGAF